MNPTTASLVSAEAEFLKTLREKTAQPHKKLDSLPVSAALMQPGITKAGYIEYLKRMHQVVLAAETLVYPWLPEEIETPGNALRHTLLENDLKFLGSTPEAIPVGFAATDAASALGVAYVIEGSALGGVYILRNITSVLGYDAQNGASFLAGNGPATGSQWKTFLDAFTRFVTDNNLEDQVISAACGAFESVHDRLSV